MMPLLGHSGENTGCSGRIAGPSVAIWYSASSAPLVLLAPLFAFASVALSMACGAAAAAGWVVLAPSGAFASAALAPPPLASLVAGVAGVAAARSEEHTSELQSRPH